MWHIQQYATLATLCLCSVPTENEGSHHGLGGNSNFHHGGNTRHQQTTNNVPVSSIPSRRQQSNINTHVQYTHRWTPGVLTGHIILELSIASLFGIVVLTKAGCEVHFDKSVCTVWYNNKIILKGGKDKATNIWMLPIGTNPSMSSHHNTVATCREPLLVSTPMLIMLQFNLHFSCILFKPKPIAPGLRINLYAAPAFLPCSKLSDVAS
jgi:hypothetical protein